MGKCDFCGGRTAPKQIDNILTTKCTNCGQEQLGFPDMAPQMAVVKVNLTAKKKAAIQSRIVRDFEGLLTLVARLDDNRESKYAKESLTYAYQAVMQAVAKNQFWDFI